MEEMAATSREITTDPVGGYVVAHLTDPAWWSGHVSAETKAIMGRILGWTYILSTYRKSSDLNFKSDQSARQPYLFLRGQRDFQ